MKLSDYERQPSIRIGGLYTLKPELIRSVISYVRKSEYWFSNRGTFTFEKGDVVLAMKDYPETGWLVCLYRDELVAVGKKDIQEVENEFR